MSDQSCARSQVREAAAVTLQRGFLRLQQRSALLRTRFAVLRVQSGGLAMLLRRWERRFARFLTTEQARLVAGCQQVLAQREHVRGNAEERRILTEVCCCPAGSPAPLPCWLSRSLQSASQPGRPCCYV